MFPSIGLTRKCFNLNSLCRTEPRTPFMPKSKNTAEGDHNCDAACAARERENIFSEINASAGSDEKV